MATIAMMTGGAIVNSLAFYGIPKLFNSSDQKRHNLAMENLQRDRDSWNESRLQRIDFINEKLKEQNHSEKTFEDVDDAMRAYYNLTGEIFPPLPPEPQLYDVGPDGSAYLDEDLQTKIQNYELGILGLGLFGTGVLVYKYV